MASLNAAEVAAEVADLLNRRDLAEVDSTWEGFGFNLQDVREAGERAVVRMRVFGKARASGVPLDQRAFQVWTWRDGKLSRNVVFTDSGEAFAAVGLGG